LSPVLSTGRATLLKKENTKHLPKNFGYLMIAILNNYATVVKEKGSPTKIIHKNGIFSTIRQTQNCIFEARIYSFLFQHFVKNFQKYPKSLENMGFCVVSCKTVISDKW
jgi:hypothetical protein